LATLGGFTQEWPTDAATVEACTEGTIVIEAARIGVGRVVSLRPVVEHHIEDGDREDDIENLHLLFV